LGEDCLDVFNKNDLKDIIIIKPHERIRAVAGGEVLN